MALESASRTRWIAAAVCALLASSSRPASADGDREFVVPYSSLEQWAKSILTTVDNLKLNGHSGVHKPDADCEMHFGGVLDAYDGDPDGIVLEPMNLCVKPYWGKTKYSKADWVTFANKLIAKNVRVRATGVMRIWPEHMSGGDPKGSNPNHVLELHPLTELAMGASTIYKFADFVFAGEFEGGLKDTSAEKILSDGGVGVVRDKDDGSVHIDLDVSRIGNFSVLSLRIKKADVLAGKQAGGHRFDGDVVLQNNKSIPVRMVTVSGSAVDEDLDRFEKGKRKVMRMEALALLALNPEALLKAAGKSKNGARVALAMTDRPFQLIVYGVPEQE